MNKKNIIKEVLKHLSNELEVTQVAANNAHLAAIDDQSIAETQYDTVAIEAGYLAEGQSKRVEEIKHSIKRFEQLDLQTLLPSSQVALGSLVQLETGIDNNEWLFIGPSAGGFTCEIEASESSTELNKVTVITPHSPMGQALINRELDDEVILLIPSHNNITTPDYISAIS